MSKHGAKSAEFYTVGDTDAQRKYLGQRTAIDWVGFFIPHLRLGMNLLDCGCGVGSITLDLSRIVDPGNVVGIDLDNEQLNFARSEATFVSPDRIAVKLKAWRLKYSKNYII